ncbi:MAG: hypothetical protein ACTHMC_16560 [Pseudobacter sp.]|uniref:hypothetical protein n=1 Tax=Pseudobacter sp. TaxID=2045420 RepID=UPI003F7CF7B0
MEDKSLQAFLNGFRSPAWLIVAVGVPILTEWIINRLKALNSAKILAGTVPEQPARVGGATAPPVNRLPRFYVSLLNTSVKFIRPLFLVCLLPLFLLGLAGFAYTAFQGEFHFTAFLYITFYTCTFGYNVMRFFGAGNKHHSRFGKIVRTIFLAGTVGHVALILFLLVHQSFYNLLLFTAPMTSMDTWVPIWFLTTCIFGGLVAMQELSSAGGRDDEALVWVLAACVGTYVLMLINLIYQVF